MDGGAVLPTFMGAAPAPPAGFPAFAPLFFRFSADNPANATAQVNQTFAPADVSTVNNRITLAGRTDFLTPTVHSTGTPVRFTSTGTLPAPLAAGTDYYLYPLIDGSTEYTIYAEPNATDWQTTPGALSEETRMPCQNWSQAVNPVVLTTQGTGVHTIISDVLTQIVADLGPRGYTNESQATNDKHRWLDTPTVSGLPAFKSRILVRDNTDSGTYNCYGKTYTQGPGALKLQARQETAGKRTVLHTYVCKTSVTDTQGLAKAPVLPANVNTTTGVLTSGAGKHGFVTGWKVNLVAYPGGTLPAGLLAGTDYFVRNIATATFSLHPTGADATANTAVIIPSTQGTVGFTCVSPEHTGDTERMRFFTEHLQTNGGGNVCTPRFNASGASVQARATDVVVSGTTNGRWGAAGRTLQSLGNLARINFVAPAASLAPTRVSTGLPLANGEYWMIKSPGSVGVMLFDNLADAQAGVGLAENLTNCIKYTAQGTGEYRMERSTFEANTSISDQVSFAAETPSPWHLPNNQLGVVTFLVDYNDPAATFIRHQIFWNGVEVANYETAAGVKGLTAAAINDGNAAWTFMNSGQPHVPFEGLIYEGMFAASAGAITAADLAPVHTYYKTKYGIA